MRWIPLVFFVMLMSHAQLNGPKTLVHAVAKGPTQVSLTWEPLAGEFYGFEVEVKSGADARYSDWTVLTPIPAATGYSCDPAQMRGGSCQISDPEGAHVYNPTTRFVPYWVTESQYQDPQDGSGTQFIAWGLIPNTEYSFRVRPLLRPGNYGSYSEPVSATTSGYRARYVGQNGNDGNDGSSAGNDHAWRTIAYGASHLQCGEVLVIGGGTYSSDKISMSQHCTPESRAVVTSSAGESVVLASPPPNSPHLIELFGTGVVIDSLEVNSSADSNGEYDVEIMGSFNALLNVRIHSSKVPTFRAGVEITGDHNLVYRCSISDYGSPDAAQNPSGNSGFVLGVIGGKAQQNVIWSNHLTRGGHDTSLASGSSQNRWLNNVMDGGWGMGWEGVYSGDHNLVEGNYVKDAGQLVSFYKPGIEVSGSYNTVRRNITVNAKQIAVEVSAFGPAAAHNLIYNNTFYNSPTCLFQSVNGGPAAYDGDVFTNNICYKVGATATDIYNGNTSNQIRRNAFVAFDNGGRPMRDSALIIWNHSANGDSQYPKSIGYADRSYNPPFSQNSGTEAHIRFVSEPDDLHLKPTNRSSDASQSRMGLVVRDSEWGTASGTLGLGAFGIPSTEPHSPRPSR